MCIRDSNGGDGTFDQVAESAGVDDAGKGISAAWADFDGDGALDFIVVKGLERNVLYRNKDTTVAARGLFVRPVDAGGRTHTGFTMGATVSLFEAGTSTRVLGGGARVIDGGGGFNSQNAYDAYFGVADVDAAVDVEVRFPSSAGSAPVVVWQRGVVPSAIDAAPFAGRRVVEVAFAVPVPNDAVHRWALDEAAGIAVAADTGTSGAPADGRRRGPRRGRGGGHPSVFSARGPGRGHPQGRGRGRKWPCVATVSYTHLTLPTKA